MLSALGESPCSKVTRSVCPAHRPRSRTLDSLTQTHLYICTKEVEVQHEKAKGQ